MNRLHCMKDIGMIRRSGRKGRDMTVLHSTRLIALLSHLLLILICLYNCLPVNAQQYPLSARWISVNDTAADKANIWIAFRKDIRFSQQPATAWATISADTKYWLWINGKLVVFEGGLKRGPNPRDTYYDKINLAPYLVKGDNRIAILLWHFGKDGFSHINSGKAGLLFHIDAGNIKYESDHNWMCRIHPAYGTAGNPPPNYRLPESNICFDARKDIDGWQTLPSDALPGFSAAREIGAPGDAPWNQLIERPIPQFKNYGAKEAVFKRIPGESNDTIKALLPYNMQMTPIISIADDSGGHLIRINTDHSVAGGTNNIRAEYITRKGIQHYESYGWMNGEKIVLIVPREVQVLGVKYRETGYDSEPVGNFSCSDTFYNRFWEKAKRTLYVNMRDNFFDCPDRERAQWWGDAVLLMGEAFYTYSTSTHALMRKAIDQLCAWQRAGGELFAPIPGNFNQELPDQMLTSIGNYGFWNYYMNTGDSRQIEKAYPAVKKYLGLWKTDETGLTILREGGWLWGDWGEHKDIRLILAGWHYIALDGAAKMADLLGQRSDARHYRDIMEKVKEGYNKCWNGSAYRHPSYQGSTDDRAQALAVISGIADSSKYAAILEILKSERNASPYMEKYVMEALFKMGKGTFALARTKDRFAEMVNDPDYTTLFEGWGIGEHGFGGGTTNHAWSGGAQIVIAESLFGIRPIKAGYQTFLVQPQPASFTSGTLTVPTVKGLIYTAFRNDDTGFRLQLKVPAGTTAFVKLPSGAAVTLNGRHVDKKPTAGTKDEPTFVTLKLPAGDYNIDRSKAL